MALIQLRRGNTEEWEGTNPVLAYGEPGVDTTLGILKVGNGADTWTNLPVIQGPPGLDGPVGPQGPAGPPGADGADGQDGANGTQGVNGTNGVDGQDGDPGVTVIHHGGVAGTARPSVPLVYWIGTSTPTNATLWDWWLPEDV